MRETNIKTYNKNFFTEIDEKFGIVVSGNKEISCNGMTVSWGGIGVIWNKYVCYLFVRKSRYTHDFFDKTNKCSISFLNDEYKKEKGIFGTKSGRDLDKFEATNLTKEYDSMLDTYYIKEADYAFLLESLYQVDLTEDNMPEEVKNKFYGTHDIHTMYVCEIKKFLSK